ncbi:MAG: type II toxin-antitoxin system prevent-host-death family antitoxin [Spirochaetia bacterium]|nr:type II toxin-antitoxin system prevent-host-death family antitoxin [Spirochaetia bacterium]
MSYTIPANELKKHGVKIIEASTEGDHEAVITMHGKTRYVVMPVETYNHLRECELQAALVNTKKSLAEGAYIEESVKDHLQRIENV